MECACFQIYKWVESYAYIDSTYGVVDIGQFDKALFVV